jgi:hypothetical protein
MLHSYCECCCAQKAGHSEVGKGAHALMAKMCKERVWWSSKARAMQDGPHGHWLPGNWGQQPHFPTAQLRGVPDRSPTLHLPRSVDIKSH